MPSRQDEHRKKERDFHNQVKISLLVTIVPPIVELIIKLIKKALKVE